MLSTRHPYRLNETHRHWLQQFAATIRTQFDFLLAQLREDPQLYRYAAAVLIQLDGDFVTLPDLVTACGKHRWNSMVYEAWAWETAQRIRAIERRLPALEAAALRVYAQEFYECTQGEMMEALQTARELLEGPDSRSPEV